jgi:transposase
MMRLRLTEKAIHELRAKRFYHPDPATQRRADIVLLCVHDIPHAKVAEIFGCHRNTVTHALHRYEQGGVEGLEAARRPGRASALSSYQPRIVESLESQPVRSVNEACERIQTLTGLRRQPTVVRHMLHHLGFRPLQSGAVPCPKKTTARQMARRRGGGIAEQGRVGGRATVGAARQGIEGWVGV